MLFIKESASFSLLHNTTPLKKMFYCFSEFQLQLQCIVLRSVTCWIIKKCQIAKKGQKGDRLLAEELIIPLCLPK